MNQPSQKKVTDQPQKPLKIESNSMQDSLVKKQNIEADAFNIKEQQSQSLFQNQPNQQHEIQEIPHADQISSSQEIIDLDVNVQRLPTKLHKYRRSKKERKTRTLITKEKLLQMNKIFHQYINNQKRNGQETWNLKTIALHLELGYSTILHKFREFRAHKKVKAGALITSMQKKRKYKKSVLVEQLILQVMNEQQFFTASEMTNYIQSKYGMKFSRSIISRHLGEMGYSYKNVTQWPNSSKIDKTRKIYTQIMKPLIERKETLIYIDEMTCSLNSPKEEENRVVSILVACTIYGVLYFHLQDGFIIRQRFYEILKEFLINLRASPLCKNIQGAKEELYLVTDMSSIHRDSSQSTPGIASMLIDLNVEIYYIPPCTPEFNPLEAIFLKIRDQVAVKLISQVITDYKSMWQQLQLILDEVKQEPTEDYFIEMCQEMEKFMDSPLQQ